MRYRVRLEVSARPVPALRIVQVDVSRFAENRHRPAAFEVRVFLAVGFATGTVAPWNVLRGAVLDRLDIAQRHLHRKPQDRRADSRVVAWNPVGHRELHGSIDVPAFDGQTGLTPQYVLATKHAVRPYRRFGQTEDRLAYEHIPEDRIEVDGVPQNERKFFPRCAVWHQLGVSLVAAVGVFSLGKARIVEQFIDFTAQGFHFIRLQHAGYERETIAMECVDNLPGFFLAEWLAGNNRTGGHSNSLQSIKIRFSGETDAHRLRSV